jgi:hypothetical protein
VDRELMARDQREGSLSRRTVILSAMGAVLVILLTGCSGGLFSGAVESGIDPQGCGSPAPRTAPYFTATPTRGAAPRAVAFTSEGTDIIEWRWSFGDGGTSSLQKPTHTYALAGTYTAELTVVRALSDGSGLTSTETFRRSRYIQISGLPDLAISGLTHAPDAGSPGTSVTFNAIVSNVGTAAATRAFSVLLSSAKSRTVAWVPSLSPGASATVALTLVMAQATETFTAKADGGSRIHELNERNNTALHIVSAVPIP